MKPIKTSKYYISVEKDTLGELVRDITCRTNPMSKSEVRRRIEEYTQEYTKKIDR